MPDAALAGRRWTRAEYYRLLDSGALPDSGIELLEGTIVETTPQRAPHATATQLVAEALRRAFPQAVVRVQFPFVVDETTEPEPDVAVVPGSVADYAQAHPSTALLVVEVADSTLPKDLRKADLYARADVPEYWVVDLGSRLVYVHREPQPSGYARRETCRDVVRPLAARGVSIPVEGFFP
jgi:Uma2 family endonuclease